MPATETLVDWKTLKELFVTGLPGTSKAEVAGLGLCLSLSVCLAEQIKAAVRLAVDLQYGKRFGARSAAAAACEAVVLVLPQVLLCMSALPLPATLATLAVLVVAGSAGPLAVHRLQPLSARKGSQLHSSSGSTVWEEDEQSALSILTAPRKMYISVFRGSLMLYTCIAILAVDFPAFPRRLAKAETFGTGLMDAGVGGVIFASGLTSKTASASTSASGHASTNWATRLAQGIRGAAACWVLGLLRLVSTRAVGYQEHVGEYGVHWNFFSTIAVVALLGAVAAPPPRMLLPVALAVTALHQGLLSLGGLSGWVMSEERGTDLVSLNKEGVGSCLGYWALYLWGAATARLLHATAQAMLAPRGTGSTLDADANPRPGAAAAAPAASTAELHAKGGPYAAGGTGQLASGTRSAGARSVLTRSTWCKQGVAWFAAVAAVDALLWLVVLLLEAFVEPVSRRSCNATYVVWITAQCLLCMLPLMAAQVCAVAAAATSLPPIIPPIAASRQQGNAGGQDRTARVDGISGGQEQTAMVHTGEHGERHQQQCLEEQQQQQNQGQACWQPMLPCAVNSSPLAVFLAANLMTGAVNLSINTMEVTDNAACAIVVCYMMLVAATALLLEHLGFRLKL